LESYEIAVPWMIEFRFAHRQLFKFARFHFVALITID